MIFEVTSSTHPEEEGALFTALVGVASGIMAIVLVLEAQTGAS